MPMLRMAVSALIALSLDLFSEVVIIHWLDLPSVHTIQVWPPYFNLVMAWNTGIDFGLLSNYGGRWLLVVFPIAVSLGLTAWVRNKRGWLLPLATGAVVGGALGNAFDRVIYGAVVDYLNISCCGINNPYSFNVADVLITCGTVFIAIGIGRDRRES
ncbi:signal peptidase II [Acidithiobacillus ferriphilus]|uniref:signal peptidase II n=1 Tax=Acidithiobacillus ferriphilus TaxID=1689834 RepID=UPI003F517088